MNALATDTLDRITAAGITLEARGADLDVIYQIEPTPEQWSWLSQHKTALLEALRSQAPAPPPPGTLSPEDQAAADELIEERAAIQEHDGGLLRSRAESEARAALRVYHYRLRDRPQSWLTMLAPGCDPEQAQEILSLRFPGQLLEVREYRHGRAPA
jgi:hypothetical protein